VHNEGRHLATEEQRERFYAARQRGGLCAACGRTLAVGEPAFLEWFILDRTTYEAGPVGVECASPEALEEAESQEPAQCGGCGRPMYRGAYNLPPQRACSRYCAFVGDPAPREAKEQR
jgi:hypothetical protein